MYMYNIIHSRTILSYKEYFRRVEKKLTTYTKMQRIPWFPFILSETSVNQFLVQHI